MQSQPKHTMPGQGSEAMHDTTLLDYIVLLFNHKKMIGTLTGAVFIISLAVSFLLPVRYQATARILPPNDSGGSMSRLMTQVEGVFGGLAGSLANSKTESELYVGILRSRTVADELVARFNLKKLYDSNYIEDVYKNLAERTTIRIDNKSHIITVSVEDRDRQRAADMANTYAETLDRIYRSLSITEGQKKRKFLEKRLSSIKEELRHAESALRAYQEKYHLVEPKEQAEAAIEVAAKIKGEIIAAQTEMEVLRQFSTDQQNEAVMLRTKIEELQRQLNKMERGSSANKNTTLAEDDNESDIFIPIGDLPELSLQLARLTREAKVQEKVFELVTSQFEMAKMEEARDMPVVQVLDRAVPPEKKSYPRRISMVLLNTFTFFIVAVVSAIIVDFVQRLKYCRPEQYDAIRHHFHYRIPKSIQACFVPMNHFLSNAKTRFLQKVKKTK